MVFLSRVFALAITAFLFALCAPSAHAVSRAEIEQYLDAQAPLYLDRVRAGEDFDIIDEHRNVSATYGVPMIGAVGLRTAARTGDDAMFALSVQTLLRPIRHDSDSPFDHLAVADAYAYGQRVYAADTRWQEAAPKMAYWLQHWEFSDKTTDGKHACWYALDCYNNWKTVELHALARMRASGLTLSAAETSRYALIQRLINAASISEAKTSPNVGRASILSDPPRNPIAYAAFSYGHISAALRLDPSLVPVIGVAHADLGRYMRAVQAPDGEIAYTGRSQSLSWTLASVMLGEANGNDATFTAAWARMRGLGVRLDGTEAIAPSVRRSNDYTGLDSYANQALYGPLTLFIMMRTAEDMRSDITPTPLPTRDSVFDDTAGAGVFAQRKGNVWFAQTMRNTYVEGRYRRGLQTVKVRASGRWQDILPARPARQAMFDLVPRVGGTQTWGPGKTTTRIVEHGVAVTITGRPGQTVSWPMWLPKTTRNGRALHFDRTRISVDEGALSARPQGRVRNSATHHNLFRTELRTRIGADGRVTVSFTLV